MRRAKIEEQNRFMLRRQRELRTAADVVTKAWMAFPEIQAIAVIGSAAKPLWKEVPRFRVPFLGSVNPSPLGDGMR